MQFNILIGASCLLFLAAMWTLRQDNQKLKIEERKVFASLVNTGKDKPRKIEKAGFIRVRSDNPKELLYRTENDKAIAMKVTFEGDFYLYDKFIGRYDALAFQPLSESELK